MSTRFTTHEVVNQPPPLTPRNLYEADPLLKSILEPVLTEDAERDLVKQGQVWGATETHELARLANTTPPSLKTHDAFGRRLDVVEFHPAYHALMRRSAEAGLHCSVWEKSRADTGRRHVLRAARYFITAQVDCGHLSSMTMTHAALGVLSHDQHQYSEWGPRVVKRAYDHRFQPAGRKSAVTLGLALTEKQAGSDMAGLETQATSVRGGYSLLTGHKWFLSAPMSDAFLMLAQADGRLTCYLVPRFREDGSLNGLRLQRLKDKLGNKSNATAEVELAEAEALPLGPIGDGAKTIVDAITLSRLDHALASAGMMRMALARAVHHTRYRSAFGVKLFDAPLMRRVMADMSLDVAAASALTFALASAYDAATSDTRAAVYARVMTPAVRYWVCKAASALTAETMEVVGGNGFVEDHDLARLYRDAPGNAIWDGSGNVMCMDLLRALRSAPDALDIVLSHIADGLGATGPASVDVLHAAARACLEDEGSARILTEQLALTAAAAELRRVAPRQIADAFIDSRLAGQWRATYGMLDARFDFPGILNYLFPVPN